MANGGLVYPQTRNIVVFPGGEDLIKVAEEGT